MATSTISSIGSQTFTKPDISSPKPPLHLSSHSRISFTSNFPKFALKKPPNHPKSAPIRASVSETMINTESYYDLLGISETDSINEIKKAYKQLAREYHPDVSPAGKTAEYTKKFIQVQEAYETLSDPKRRAFYDRDTASGLGLHANFSARSRRYGQGTGDMSDWEHTWQSQLAELIRRSNSKGFESWSWGDEMRRRKNYSN